MAISDHFDTVQEIYIGFYQRPADPAGLTYWAEQIEAAGGDAAAVIDAFATSAEAQDVYGDINQDTIGGVIDAIYDSLFDRVPDPAGKAYYEAEFAAGNLTPGNIAIAILESAQGADVTAVDNKLTVAKEFTQQVDGRELNDPEFGTGENFAFAYEGEDAAAAARALLDGVTADPETVLTPEEIQQALQENAAGDAFTLTEAENEVLEGSAADDTFNAAVGDNATLNDGDQIDGKEGTDTLNIDAAGEFVIPESASVKNVEQVNVAVAEGTTGTIAADRFSGVQQLTQTGNAIAVSGVSAEAVASFKELTVDSAVEVGFTADSGNIDLSQVNFAEGGAIQAGGDALKTLNLTGDAAAQEGDEESQIVLQSQAAVETLNVALQSNTTLDLGAASGASFTSLSTINAADSTGGLNLDLSGTAEVEHSGLPALQDVTLGAGDDVIDLGEQDNVTITLGAGNDTVTVSGKASGTTITTGEGADTIVFEGVPGGLQAEEGKSFEESFLSSITRITDFNGGEDVLIFNTEALPFAALDAAARGKDPGEALEGVEGGDLLGALQNIAEATGANSWVSFEFDGNTYVYVNDGDAAFDEGDGLIELVGCTDDMTEANLVV